MSKELSFSCGRISVDPAGKGIAYVEMSTEYPDEILDCFEPEEIISHYDSDKLNALYEELQDHFSN